MPRSNGVAEAAVKEMKKLIRANLKSSGTIDTQSTLAGLIMFRNTPRSPTNKSPAELLFGRQIRDSLPCPRDNLLPQYRYYSEEKLDRHETNKQAGPTKELPLLSPKTSRGGLEVEYTASKVGALRRWFESRLGRNLRD